MPDTTVEVSEQDRAEVRRVWMLCSSLRDPIPAAAEELFAGMVARARHDAQQQAGADTKRLDFVMRRLPGGNGRLLGIYWSSSDLPSYREAIDAAMKMAGAELATAASSSNDEPTPTPEQWQKYWETHSS